MSCWPLGILLLSDQYIPVGISIPTRDTLVYIGDLKMKEKRMTVEEEEEGGKRIEEEQEAVEEREGRRRRKKRKQWMKRRKHTCGRQHAMGGRLVGGDNEWWRDVCIIRQQR